jgi:hypothetical protein
VRRLALALLPLLLSGCLEEELTLELQPDGQGTLRIERTLAAGEGDVAAATLARWEGISAWCEITSATLADGRRRVRALGFFADPNQLRRRAPGEGLSFQREQVPGALSLVLREELGPDAGELLDPSSLHTLAPRRAQLAAALEGYRRQTTIVLPNEVAASAGGALDSDAPTRLVRNETGESVLASFDGLEEELRRLLERLDAQPSTRADALKQLQVRLDVARTLRARCEVNPGTPASEAFRARLAQAREAWASSPWRARVEAARARLGLAR